MLTKGFAGENSPLDWFPAEDVNQLDDQDYNDHQFENKGAGLVELVDHEVIELLGSLQFLLHQIFVIGHADSGGRQLVQTSGEHVAEELDGVVGSFNSS